MEPVRVIAVKTGLCVNCINNQNCALKSDFVMECEEHAAELMNQPYDELQNEMLPTEPVPSHQGICSTCNLATNCAWRQEGIIRFQCEHYQ